MSSEHETHDGAAQEQDLIPYYVQVAELAASAADAFSTMAQVVDSGRMIVNGANLPGLKRTPEARAHLMETDKALSREAKDLGNELESYQYDWDALAHYCAAVFAWAECAEEEVRQIREFWPDQTEFTEATLARLQGLEQSLGKSLLQDFDRHYLPMFLAAGNGLAMAARSLADLRALKRKSS